MSNLAEVAARLLQADVCPATDPSCAPRAAVPREPIFDGFGVHEFLVIGAAVLATLVGLIVVAWLLVHLTGAHRDYEPLQPRPVTNGPDPRGGSAGSLFNGGGARRPRPQISPSTWVGVGFVFVLAVGAASWIALRGDDDTVTTATTTSRPLSTSTVTPAASVTTIPPSCTKPTFNAALLPAGFVNELVAGFGAAISPEPLCAFHWQGANSVISVLTTGDSPLGPLGTVQQKIEANGRTVWVGPAQGGGIGVVFEEKELGGAPDIWFTLISTTVPRNELIDTALNLQLA
ncbi:MAG TPA: hypothetical protein VM282_11810 [Acidimicrobiales bacterium]|nr:hypothetical protein [Acidimicrobiales bacterium]